MRRDGYYVPFSEADKKEGLSYAWSDAGIELPAIDVTHPAFEIDIDENRLATMTASAVHDMDRRGRLPQSVQRLFLAVALRRSIIVGHIAQSRGTYLDGIGTYLLKLGVENLGKAIAGTIDRKLADSIVGLSARLRLADTATLLAEAAGDLLSARNESREPLHLVNIGGGTAVDSFNAVLVLNRDRPDLLTGRRIIIHVLDRDSSGPLFGMRAVGALHEPGAALSGLDVDLRYVRYDWANPGDLAPVLEQFGSAAVVGSSEGGLFEYGTDAEIVENLDSFARHAPSDAAFVGTISRSDGDAGRINFSSGAAIVRRELTSFRRLTDRVGWTVERVVNSPLSHCVRLTRATVAPGCS